MENSFSTNIPQISPIDSVRFHTNSVDSICAHPLENRFITASFDKTCAIWDCNNIRKPLQVIKSPHIEGI